ncbi:MAG TPA: hypothetical protein VGE24_11195, partial [Emticicia sp.]
MKYLFLAIFILSQNTYSQDAKEISKDFVILALSCQNTFVNMINGGLISEAGDDGSLSCTRESAFKFKCDFRDSKNKLIVT